LCFAVGGGSDEAKYGDGFIILAGEAGEIIRGDDGITAAVLVDR
jgi:hypothetical protein